MTAQNTTNHELEYPDDSNYQDYTQNKTSHDDWVVISESEGGSKTRPCIVLPEEPTGRRWRITYEEMTE